MKKTVLLLIFIFPLISSFAQKSSPVIGDAATLIDLLHKDYNSINPETWDEEINTDRGKVIAIFKSYLDDIQRNRITISPAVQVKVSYDNYIKAKESVNALNKLNINVSASSQLSDVKKSIENLQDSLRSKKNAYYLKKYRYDTVEFEELGKAYADNDYLKNLIGIFKEKYDNVYNKAIDNAAETNTYSSIQKSIPFIGGDLSFKTIIDGLSRFLAKRIKEELTIHAIDKIKQYLENPTPENYCHELLVLLPSTTNYLKQFESNQLLNFTDEMKQYIEQDLNNLLDNAVDLKDTPRLKRYIYSHPDLEFAFEGLEIIPQLSKIKNPVDYFELVENSRCLAKWRANATEKTRFNISQGLRLASMLAYSLTVVDNGEAKFASADMISNYGNEINFFYLYFGMLHQQNKKYFNISFIPRASALPVPLKIEDMMNDVSFKYGQIKTDLNVAQFLKTNLTAVATNAEKIYAQALALKKKKKSNEEIKYEEVYGFVDDFISFAEEVVTTSDMFITTTYKFYNTDIHADFDLKKTLEPYFKVTRVANNMMLDLHQKKYSNAIIKALEIPLSFKGENGGNLVMLQDVKTAIETHQDLNKMKNVFALALAGPDANKISELKSVQVPLEILSIKLDEADALGELKRCLNRLNKAIVKVEQINPAAISDKDKESIEEAVSEYGELKALFKENYKPILNYYGINTEEIINSLKTTLYPGNQNTKVVIYLEKKFDQYTKNAYCKVTLGEADSITLEKELLDFINEFVSKETVNDTKLTDNNAIKVIHFVNEMAGAKDAEEVEKAIDAFALPVGSSSLKEKAKSYFSINAYPGLIGGIEYAKGQQRAGSFGFTAPVGLYAQFCSWGSGSSLGAFVPIIDIGAPVRLRIDKEKDNEILPDFNFNDIFSPGFYLSYGFGKKLPLALNVGAQYGPKLRDVKTGVEGKLTAVDSYRVNIALVIDIPLFTISGRY